MHIVAANAEQAESFDSIVTATVSADQLSGVLPHMEKPDAFAAPGPTRSVRVRLSSGHDGVLVFHERKGFVEILSLPVGDVERDVAELLIELGIRVDAITWVSDRVDQERLRARMRTAKASNEDFATNAGRQA